MDRQIEKGCAWIATGIAVSIAIYITKSYEPLWAFCIPAFFL
jgi:hypothetical protein